jgi:hypothetical protein
MYYGMRVVHIHILLRYILRTRKKNKIKETPAMDGCYGGTGVRYYLSTVFIIYKSPSGPLRAISCPSGATRRCG